MKFCRPLPGLPFPQFPLYTHRSRVTTRSIHAWCQVLVILHAEPLCQDEGEHLALGV